MNEETKNLIKIVNREGKNLLSLDYEGKITWPDQEFCTEQDFKNVVVYLFDIVYRQQARLFEVEQEILKILNEKKEENLIKLPH